MKGKPCILFMVCISVLLITGCYLFNPVSQLDTFKLDQAALNIEVGQQAYLSIEMDPVIDGVEISTSTDNSETVTHVRAGNIISVIGLKPGITTLTVKALDKTTTCLITVTNGGSVDPGDYYLEPDTTLLIMAPSEEIIMNCELVNGSKTDQNNIVWIAFDPSIVNVFGSGRSVIITAKRAGQTQIIITHSLSPKNVAINVKINEGTQSIYLSKTNLSLAINDQYEISAHVATNVPDPDWQTVVWDTTTPVNEAPVISILGSGQTISIIALSAGQTRLRATTQNGSMAYCDIVVNATKKFYFSQNLLYIQPTENKTIGFVLSPINEPMDWFLTNSSIASFSYDLSTKLLYISGLQEGLTTLIGQSNSGELYDFCEIVCEYNRTFELATYSIVAEPTGPVTISYTMNPYSDPISAISNNPNVATVTIDKNAHTITVTPKNGTVESSCQITCIGAGISRTLDVNWVFNKTLTVDEPTLTGLDPHAGPHTVQFHQTPAFWNATAISSDTAVATVTVNNVNKTFTVTPIKEGSFNITLSGSGLQVEIPGSFICNHSWQVGIMVENSTVGKRTYPDMWAAWSELPYPSWGADVVGGNSGDMEDFNGGVWAGIAGAPSAYGRWGDQYGALLGDGVGLNQGQPGCIFYEGQHTVKVIIVDQTGKEDKFMNVSLYSSLTVEDGTFFEDVFEQVGNRVYINWENPTPLFGCVGIKAGTIYAVATRNGEDTLANIKLGALIEGDGIFPF